MNNPISYGFVSLKYKFFKLRYMPLELGVNDARVACIQFGTGWNVAKVSVGALVCTKDGHPAGLSCFDCQKWRLLVWDDGEDDKSKGDSGDQQGLSTKAGSYYGGHTPCTVGDNFPLCGQWADNFGNTD